MCHHPRGLQVDGFLKMGLKTSSNSAKMPLGVTHSVVLAVMSQ